MLDFKKFNGKHTGIFAAGVLFGTAGIKILSSKDAKKVYTPVSYTHLERTIQLYCSDVSYFLRWIGKNVSDLTLEDAESFLTAKRLEDVYKRQSIYRISDSL